MTTTQLSQTLFPNRTKPHFDFQTVHEVLAFWRLQLGEVTFEQLTEDTTKVPESRTVYQSTVGTNMVSESLLVDLLPSLLQRRPLILVQFLDCLLNLLLILIHRLKVLDQLSFSLFDAV